MLVSGYLSRRRQLRLCVRSTAGTKVVGSQHWNPWFFVVHIKPPRRITVAKTKHMSRIQLAYTMESCRLAANYMGFEPNN